MEDTHTSTQPTTSNNNGMKQVAGAIVLVGIMISGAILLKGSAAAPTARGVDYGAITIKPVSADDQVLGDPKAKVTVIAYEDFQCPWCGKIHGEAEKQIRDKYVASGDVSLVYRDFAFLGTFVQPYTLAKDESINAAAGARCAADQGKFWEYHDYLFEHQNGENQGNFSVPNLKTIAVTVGLDQTSFNTCLDTNKYVAAVDASKEEGRTAGVQGTPKMFILKKGKIVDTVDGYMPADQVMEKVAKALK